MKKGFKSIMLLAAAAMAFTACNKENDIQDVVKNGETTTIRFSAAVNDAETKATLTTEDEKSFKAAWEEGDKMDITVTSGSSVQIFPATWNGNFFEFEVPTEWAETVSTWYYEAYYPSKVIPFGSNRIQNGSQYASQYDAMQCEMATFKNAKCGLDSEGGHIVLPMTRVSSILYFHLTSDLEETLASATLTVDEGTIAAETVAYDYEINALAAEEGTGSNTITLTFAEGTAPSAKDFCLWYNVIPGKTTGMTLTITTTSGKTATLSNPSGKTYLAGKLNKVVKTGLTWVNPQPAEKYYVKVTSTAELTDGDYLIVYEDEDGAVAFDGGLETLDAASNTIEVVITEDGIKQTKTVDAAIFTYNSANGTLKSASGYYIGRTANSNGLNVSKTEGYTNTISFNNGNAIITASGGCILRYNATAGQDRFRYYKSGQQAIQLYKLEDNRQDPGMSWNASSATATIEDGDVINFTAPTLTAGYATGITYESSDPTVASVSAAGEVSILAEGETTIKAIFAGDTEYKPQTVQYTLTVTDNRTPVVTYDFETVAELNALATDTATEFFGTLTNAVISFVPNTSNAVIKDATGSVLVFKENHGYKQGQTFSGELTVKVKLYNNASEITEINKEFVGEGTVVEPETVTLSDLVGNFNSWQNAYVHVDDLEVVSVNNNKTINVKNGDNTYVVFSSSANATCVTGDIIAVTGTIAQFNNKDQIKVWTADDIDITQEHQKAKHTITFTQPEEGGSFTVSANGSQIVSGTELDEGTVVSLNATADDGYIFDGWTVTGTTVNDDIFTVGTEDITITASFKVNTGTTTATIYFGTNNVKINATSVTGEDSEGNIWNINTVITDPSFTQQPTYSQVGASKKPATSITFTTTLPETVQKVDNLSITLGGFSGTEGTVNLKVGDVAIGTGNLNGTNDVTVSSTTEAQGNTIQITVTGISKGVKVYNIVAEYE